MTSFTFRSILGTLLFSGFIAWQAGRMGYSRLIWLLAGILSPFIGVVMLVMLPDRSRWQRRAAEAELLRQQLLAAGLSRPSAETAIPRQTISDQRTRRDEPSGPAPSD